MGPQTGNMNHHIMFLRTYNQGMSELFHFEICETCGLSISKDLVVPVLAMCRLTSS